MSSPDADIAGQRVEDIVNLSEKRGKMFFQSPYRLPSVDDLRRTISHPRFRQTALAFGIVAVVGLSTLVASSFLDQGKAAQAAGQPVTKQSINLQRPPNPYYFINAQGVQDHIVIIHGDFSFPDSPNPPGMTVDSLYLYIGDSSTWTARTQPNTSLHSLAQQWGGHVTIEGVLVDPQTRRLYMATSTGCIQQDLVCPDGVEIAPDVTDMNNYGARIMTGPDGMPQDGSLGDPTSTFDFKTDATGKAGIERTIINSPSGKDGPYLRYKDALGNFVGNWFLQQINGFKAFLPFVVQRAPAY